MTNYIIQLEAPNCNDPKKLAIALKNAIHTENVLGGLDGYLEGANILAIAEAKIYKQANGRLL